MPKILKNPTNKTVEFMYDGRVFIFSPGEVKALDTEVAQLALEFNNTPLLDVTQDLNVNPRASGEVTKANPTPNLGSELITMQLPQLLKLAKSKGIKVKFGMRKNEVLDLLLHGKS